ncbi:hypothetical protein ACFW9D_22605 [Streptomyces sp. NPDC059524]|uniref:hypothetical protein n=1 Tax=Streptomyces sp. NPDC059524 TaxID=3346856 RepID=UPI00368226AB
MPSFATDPRHTELVTVLTPLLRRTLADDAGGYGGSYELHLTAHEAVELGGISLIRSAMRKAARSLGWSPLKTYGAVYESVAVAGVLDQREIPEPFATAVEQRRLERGRASAEIVGKNMQDGRHRAVPGSVFLTTQEFRAAYATR